MKKRIWFVLFVLGITPFARSCSITAGFPFPVVKNVGFSTMSVCPSFVLLLLANIVILSLIAVILVKRQQSIRWLSAFYHALLINLAAGWAGFLIGTGYDTDPPVLLNAFFTGIFYYLCKVPDMVSNEFYSSENRDVIDDILYRAWFVVITIALTLIIYWAKRIKDKRAKVVGLGGRKHD